jgi:hypothetical protein
MDNKDEEQITFDSYREQIDVWYRVHNIIREKTELYYDFISSLLHLINDTYLGSDVIKSEKDIANHFNWCFNRVISNFEQERIHFTIKNDQYDYLWFLFLKAFYQCNTEDKVEILDDYFKVLFNFNKVKTSSELESFIDIYKIFDQNLRKIN